MTDIEITDRQLKAFRRFLNRLPHGKELELVVLKAHLLMEEQINLLVDERTKNPTALEEAKLESFHRICLAQSFFPPDHQPWLWKALKKLNTLRNRIAHDLDPKGVEDKIEDFVSSFPGEIGKTGDDRQTRFELTLWSMFDAVSELVEPRKAPVVELVDRNEP
jgi:hypothetical protein